MKLMIGTPAMNGWVDIEYAYALAKTLHECNKRNLAVQVVIRRSGSLIISERNKILEQFRKSDCTHLLCIDADIGWEPDHVFALLDRDLPIVGACYLSKGKKAFIFRPLPGDSVDIVDGLIEMRAIPAGFIMINKLALLRMIGAHEDLYYKSLDSDDHGYGLFNTCVRDSEYWGEDFSFCLRARDAGLKVMVDPHISLWHDGNREALYEALMLEQQYQGVT